MHSLIFSFLVLNLVDLLFYYHFVRSGPEVVTFLQNDPSVKSSWCTMQIIIQLMCYLNYIALRFKKKTVGGKLTNNILSPTFAISFRL